MAVTVREQLGGNAVFPPPRSVTDRWRPDPCPDLTPEQVPWGDRTCPWNADISSWPVDAERTKALARPDVNVSIDVGVTGDVWDGSVAGMPYQVTKPTDRATLVLDRARPAVVKTEKRWIIWPFWSIDVPVDVVQPIEAITLPEPVVRREGDPNGAWDRHAYIIRPEAKRLIEIIQLEHAPMFGAEWTAGYDGGGPGIASWMTDRAWDASGQPGGIVAGGFPQFPHCIRYDELAAGIIRHALFCALANYNPGRTGYARNSDGTMPAHPCRAGERLRLPRGQADRRWRKGSLEHTVGLALETYGVTIGDRTDHSGSATTRPAGINAAQDLRIRAAGWKGLGLRLSDLEVVAQ